MQYHLQGLEALFYFLSLVLLNKGRRSLLFLLDTSFILLVVGYDNSIDHGLGVSRLILPENFVLNVVLESLVNRTVMAASSHAV